MAEIGHHCPFLNRSDARCSAHFSLERLDRAFAHCFGDYHECGVYLELLMERRARPLAAGQEVCDETSPLVRIGVPSRLRQQAA